MELETLYKSCSKYGEDHAVPITFVDRTFGTSKLGGSEIVEYLKAHVYLLLTTYGKIVGA
uniref:Uncharacterized protein n=1 Tax=Arundo donax TaxID=35708 RepID=A0A0A9AU78_ARUDO